MVASGYGAVDRVLRAGDSMTGALSVAANVITWSSTVTINAATSNHVRITLGGATTMAAPANPADTQVLRLELIQDATGSRLVTWNAVFAFSTGLPQPVLTTAPGKRDFLIFLYNATTMLWYFTGFVNGF